MWLIPIQKLEKEDKLTVNSNQIRFQDTKEAYYIFYNDLINRVKKLNDA